MGFTVPDGVDPGGCDVVSNLGQGDPDQQIEEVGGPVDGLVRQPGGQPNPNLLSQAPVPPPAIDRINLFQEALLAVRSGPIRLIPGSINESDCFLPLISRICLCFSTIFIPTRLADTFIEIN